MRDDERCERTAMLLGSEGVERLRRAFVAVIGLGGVGSYAAEALARAGVGRLRIVDCDVAKATDLNRQLFAVRAGVGRPKVELARERLLSVDPDLTLDARNAFFHADTAPALVTPDLDFVIDAIDGLAPKVELIRHCVARKIPVLSAMGAGGRTDPAAVRIDGINATTVCPLARLVRRKLRGLGVTEDIPVVFSTEPPRAAREAAGEGPVETEGACLRGRPRRAQPSLPTIPGIFGLVAANYVILRIAGG